ncbi:MAG: DUF4411 family protein [Ignavibacteriaceae bacterium]|jgi:hypothetical protein|nr:DUF4411 family protein [Ignavibacteriaceae bacterium]
MKVVIDTNSLLSLVRYYLPFDKNSILFDFIKYKIERGEIIIIDKVLEECSYNSKGLVIQKLSYLKDKSFLKSVKLPFKTETLIAPSPAKFLRQVDNQFVNTIIRRQRNLTDVEYENQKNHFLEDADMRLIILCLNLIKDNQDEEVILVTEETESSNDNKLFKKVPAICKEINIKTMSLPELLQKYDNIEVEFK